MPEIARRYCGEHWPRQLAKLCAGAALSVLLLSGCGLFGSSGPNQPIQTRLITFQVAQAANQDSPVAVDIVYVLDPQLIPQLSQMTAHDWFQKRSSIRQAFPAGFDLTSRELVPGQKAPDEEIKDPTTDAIAAFVFANYSSEGTHRARVDALEHISIALGEKDFSIMSQDMQ